MKTSSIDNIISKTSLTILEKNPLPYLIVNTKAEIIYKNAAAKKIKELKETLRPTPPFSDIAAWLRDQSNNTPPIQLSEQIKITSLIHEKKPEEHFILSLHKKTDIHNMNCDIANNLKGMIYQYQRNNDGSFQFNNISESCKELYDVTAKDATQTPLILHKKIHPDDIKKVEKSSQLAYKNKHDWVCEFRIIANNQIKWIQAKAKLVSTENNTFIWNGICIDISEQKKAEKKAKKEATKTAFMHDVLATMSHEIKTPLYAISLITKLLKAKDKQEQNYIQEINSNTNFLMSLISQILNDAELEKCNLIVRKNNINLHTFIHDLLKQTKTLADNKKILISNIITCHNKTDITIDEAKTEQIIRNLLSNAIKFSPPKNTITLKTTISNNNLYISVKDEGIGIPEDKWDIIFEKYSQLSNQNHTPTSHNKGVGLGLAICKALVTLQKGKIWLKPSEKGACFCISIPI
eukprot:COSAG01_NODE_69_length_28801_cov_10.460038_10_plen_464_part_00